MRNAAGLLGFFAIVLSACSVPVAPAEPLEDASQLLGTWDIDHPDWRPAYVIFRDDGSYTFSPNLDGSNGQSGEYWFEAGSFYLRDLFCRIPGQYGVGQRPSEGQAETLVFTLQQDDCPPRIRILTRREPARVAP